MSHLTDKQKQHIFDTAVDLILEDVECDQDYLMHIIEYYVSTQDIEVQLAMISSNVAAGIMVSQFAKWLRGRLPNGSIGI